MMIRSLHDFSHNLGGFLGLIPNFYINSPYEFDSRCMLYKPQRYKTIRGQRACLKGFGAIN
ncbi:hypothetical protein I7I50_02450 [Histoplasma capsulatum G186AR]|uniref:Uncharacterized protein n=1 Tax=Ajellomyces capsulatus TaxID=5037 RepID=A0A8H8D630_AJECA|nr:hypothetical protein I7I52_00886 [Histoplasma capsulatum]QSS71569.1 hypothetical protein I7I50_02450 [Histoplasma capsulatum G186AR]